MTESRQLRRLAAIVAADVAGYSSAMEADESGTLARLQAMFRDVVRPRVAEQNGRIFKETGDGFLAEFPSAVNAAECASRIQASLAGGPMQLRLGLHLGDVIVADDDLFGDGINIAARLEQLCRPGEIYVSGAIHEQIDGKLALIFEDLGEQKAKNLSKPIRVYRARRSVDEEADGQDAAAMAFARRVPSIAVLPFRNISGDAEQEYFADGLTEDIITALSVWRSFPVVSRSSTFAYKGRAVNTQRLGRELGAGYVLEGSVRRAGERVRISAQLVDAGSGSHLWAQKFDGDLEDIFEVQDEITRRIAATVVPELERVETRRSAAVPPRNLDAWDCYLRGLAFLHEATREGNIQAHAMFERALALDPTYGPAFTGIAYILNRDLLLGYAGSFEDTVANCLEAARRAVDLDESAAISRTELVRALLWAGQHDAAVAEAKAAIELNPYNVLARFWLGATLACAGREMEAIPLLETVTKLAPRDPRNQFYLTHLALAYLSAGQPEQALEPARQAALRSSDFLEAPIALASILGHLGRATEARAVLERVAVADLRCVARRPYWRRYRHPKTKELVLQGLRKVGLPE